MSNGYDRDKAVGFFDSGVGGISVLKEAIRVLPRENFIYLGDSKNAPYGTKSVDEVRELSFKATEFLIGNGAKAIVVACNTATSAAIEDLRSKYKDIPFIGIEPALKPAVEMQRKGKIIVMATPMTLSEKKFSSLLHNYGKKIDIQQLPCPGLVELIERGILEGCEMEEFLQSKLGRYLEHDIAAIVLGCTHYPFIRKTLSNLVGEDVPIVDGSVGTAKQLRRLLLEKNLMSERIEAGKVSIYNSSDNKDLIKLSYNLLES